MPAKPSKARRQRLKRQQAEAARLAQEQPETDESEQAQPGDVRSVGPSIAGVGEKPLDGVPDREIRQEIKLLNRAIRAGWIAPADLAPVRYDLESSPADTHESIQRSQSRPSYRQLMMRSVGRGMLSQDERSVRIATRNALLMEAANQKDEIERERSKRHAEDMEIKRALLQIRGGHTDESIPTGVVLLERYPQSEAAWEAQMERHREEREAAGGVVELPEIEDSICGGQEQPGSERSGLNA